MMRIEWIAAALLSAAVGVAVAKLPPPTPEQQQAAAAKKDAQAAQVEQQKQALEKAQDRVVEYYKRTKGTTQASTQRGGQTDAANMPKTTKELPGQAGPQGGKDQSAEAHSTNVK
ncbi:MAG TPA: hypothetical protein VED01_23615 [Burkholderiales bacterium]|nr:hypothetical protein [Burkholderiales bacterium]